MHLGRVPFFIGMSKRIESGTLTVIVPDHKEIAIGTLRSILRQARISLEEFEDL
ncbi:type II toxin-antitoxin system HicA family toxin [Leptospira santarosai]|uniref:type II toxin-antitoxin system HicA family toxin n=1 Tax=Leptospira santarosai TaxID=28183 RepID=UPI001F1AB1F8|nr:type II toxin-antitoxin system HicA family toxin [Leptospira santarosai]